MRIVHTPGRGRVRAVLQRAFGTVPLSGADWVACALVASSVLWLRELSKIFSRMTSRKRLTRPTSAARTRSSPHV